MGKLKRSVRRPVVPCAAMAGATVLALMATSTPASAATLVSETTWGGAGSEVTTGVAVAPDGSTYLTGFTTSFDPFGRDNVFLVKLAADGSPSWQRTWDGPEQFGIDRANDIAVAPDGSIYVTGHTVGVRGDVLLLKFSPDGSLAWQRRWDSGLPETGEAVAVASDGSIYVTGGSNGLGELGPLVVLRFAPDGTLVWQRTWADVASGDGIAVGPDGNIDVAGVAPRPGPGFNFDMVLLKLAPPGLLLWQRAYSTAEVADARGGVAVAADGSVYVTGGIQEVRNRTAVNDTLITKFGPDGSLTWDRGYGGDNGDFPGGVVALADGTILIGGETASVGAGSDDAFLLHVDTTGKGIACNAWGGSGIDQGNDVAVAPDNTIALGATTMSSPPYTLGDCPRRTKSLRGTVATPGIPLAEGTGALADPNGTVATPNGSSPGAGGFDAALVRAAQP
jgi:uncharacterized delta-60 repeat protein